MIGVNCGGSVSPVTARKMIKEKFGVDPNTVTKEEIDKGQFIIEYEGGHKGISMDELEEAGYGRRSQLPPLQGEDPPPGRPCLRELGCHRRQGRKGNLCRGLLREGCKTSRRSSQSQETCHGTGKPQGCRDPRPRSKVRCSSSATSGASTTSKHSPPTSGRPLPRRPGVA